MSDAAVTFEAVGYAYAEARTEAERAVAIESAVPRTMTKVSAR